MQVKLAILRITDLCLIFFSSEPLNEPAVKKIISCHVKSFSACAQIGFAKIIEWGYTTGNTFLERKNRDGLPGRKRLNLTWTLLIPKRQASVLYQIFCSL
jgi:hypothetical protein